MSKPKTTIPQLVANIRRASLHKLVMNVKQHYYAPGMQYIRFTPSKPLSITQALALRDYLETQCDGIEESCVSRNDVIVIYKL